MRGMCISLFFYKKSYILKVRKIFFKEGSNGKIFAIERYEHRDVPHPDADIVRMADILRCCDIYEALIEDRPYRKRMSTDQAVKSWSVHIFQTMFYSHSKKA